MNRFKRNTVSSSLYIFKDLILFFNSGVNNSTAKLVIKNTVVKAFSFFRTLNFGQLS